MPSSFVSCSQMLLPSLYTLQTGKFYLLACNFELVKNSCFSLLSACANTRRYTPVDVVEVDNSCANNDVAQRAFLANQRSPSCTLAWESNQHVHTAMVVSTVPP